MKYKIVPLFLVLVFVLTACAKKTQESTDVSSQIFTAVANTLTAQYTPIVETATFPATATSTVTTTPAATLMLINTPTIANVIMTAGGCDNSAYVSDVTIADGTVITVGSKFTKTWTIKNTGTCTWTSTYMLKFASGSQMSGTSTAIGSSVAPGSSINVSVSMTAPTTPGTYTGYWRLVNDSSSFFGGYVTVKIVASGAATVTGTTTATITRTPTITPIYVVVTATPNPTSTNTTVPVVTTAVPTLTETPVATTSS